MITKIYLVRHGKTAKSEYEQVPEDPLSDIGKQQVTHAAQRLQHLGSVAIIYTSTYTRAKESGKIISETVECPAVYEDDSLNEIGTWTSPTQLHDPKTAPEKYAQAIETLTLSQQKAVTFLRKIATEHSGKNIIVVCHGNIIRAIISQAIAAGVETTVRLNVNNASISILEYDAEDGAEPFFRLTLFNDTGHID